MLEPEELDCEILTLRHVREATPRKYHQNDYLNRALTRMTQKNKLKGRGKVPRASTLLQVLQATEK